MYKQKLEIHIFPTHPELCLQLRYSQSYNHQHFKQGKDAPVTGVHYLKKMFRPIAVHNIYFVPINLLHMYSDINMYPLVCQKVPTSKRCWCNSLLKLKKMVTFHDILYLIKVLEIFSKSDICDHIKEQIYIKIVFKHFDANLRCGVTPNGINTFILADIIPIFN